MTHMRDAFEAGVQHLCNSATDFTGWLSDVEGVEVYSEFLILVGAHGLIDIEQAVEEVLQIAEPYFRKQFASELKEAQGSAAGLMNHTAARGGYIVGMAHAAQIIENGAEQ